MKALVLAAAFLMFACEKEETQQPEPTPIVIEVPAQPAPTPVPEPTPAPAPEPVPVPVPVAPKPPEPVLCNGTWKKTQQFVVGACSKPDLVGTCKEVANTKVKFDCGLEFTCICN